MNKSKPKIAVVGSVNMDLLMQVPSLPRPGETIIASQSEQVPGGKGANQAVAAAMLGGDVSMIARVGDDAFGSALLLGLAGHGVKTGAVLHTMSCSSGLAIVNVEASGENSIVAVPGANGRVTTDDVNNHAAVIESADVLLVQFEIPLETVARAMEIARERKIPIILDPAPAKASPPGELFKVDYACPNETEAEALTGIAISDTQSATAAATRLKQMGVRTPIVTLGKSGALFLNEANEAEVIRAPSVQAVDTTAAGDAFAGALTVGIGRGLSAADAVKMACRAGAWAATKLGAQPSMPSAEDLASFD